LWCCSAGSTNRAKKKRRLAKQTVASLSAQGPDLDCSRLAVMNATMIPLASDLLIRFRWQMRREDLLASASSPTGLRHSVALGVSTLTFRDVQRLWRPECKESLAVANKPQSRDAVVPRIERNQTEFVLNNVRVWHRHKADIGARVENDPLRTLGVRFAVTHKTARING